MLISLEHVCQGWPLVLGVHEEFQLMKEDQLREVYLM